MLKTELDARRPVAVDFKYIGPQYPVGFAGHTLSVCGYIAAHAGQATTRQALSQKLDQMLSERITVKDPVPPASKKKRKKLTMKTTLTLLTALLRVTTFRTETFQRFSFSGH